VPKGAGTGKPHMRCCGETATSLLWKGLVDNFWQKIRIPTLSLPPFFEEFQPSGMD